MLFIFNTSCTKLKTRNGCSNMFTKLKTRNGCSNVFAKRNKMNWVLDTNSDFGVPISPQPDLVDFYFFKLLFFSNRTTSFSFLLMKRFKGTDVSWPCHLYLRLLANLEDSCPSVPSGNQV